jgi:hypothetical protein
MVTRRAAAIGARRSTVARICSTTLQVIRGEFLFHCHILDREDQGMMAKIEAI